MAGLCFADNRRIENEGFLEGFEMMRAVATMHLVQLMVLMYLSRMDRH